MKYSTKINVLIALILNFTPFLITSSNSQDIDLWLEKCIEWSKGSGLTVEGVETIKVINEIDPLLNLNIIYRFTMDYHIDGVYKLEFSNCQFTDTWGTTYFLPNNYYCASDKTNFISCPDLVATFYAKNLSFNQFILDSSVPFLTNNENYQHFKLNLPTFLSPTLNNNGSLPNLNLGYLLKENSTSFYEPGKSPLKPFRHKLEHSLQGAPDKLFLERVLKTENRTIHFISEWLFKSAVVNLKSISYKPTYPVYENLTTYYSITAEEIKKQKIQQTFLNTNIFDLLKNEEFSHPIPTNSILCITFLPSWLNNLSEYTKTLLEVSNKLKKNSNLLLIMVGENIIFDKNKSIPIFHWDADYKLVNNLKITQFPFCVIADSSGKITTILQAPSPDDLQSLQKEIENIQNVTN